MKKHVLTGSAALTALGGATLVGCAPTPAPYVPPPPALGCYLDPGVPPNPDINTDLDFKLIGAAGTLASIEAHIGGTNCGLYVITMPYLAAPDAVTALAACEALDPVNTNSAFDLAAYTNPGPLAGYFVCSPK